MLVTGVEPWFYIPAKNAENKLTLTADLASKKRELFLGKTVDTRTQTTEYYTFHVG